jgi:GxxExxY protein
MLFLFYWSASCSVGRVGFDTENAEGTKIAEKFHTEQRDSRTERIIGLGIKVHRCLGPGLLESVYAECLCWEFRNSGMSYTREVPLAVTYEDMRLNPAYRADIIVEGEVILEIKSIERILPVHEAQTLTYLRLSGCRVGLLMNFNSVVLKDGLRRFVK